MRFTLFSSFLSNSVNRPHFSRHMGLCARKVVNLIRLSPPPPGRRSGLGAPKPAKPCTSIPGAPSPPSDKRRKDLSGGPASAQIFTSSFQKEELTTNAFSCVRRQFLPSPPARPFSALPGRALLASGVRVPDLPHEFLKLRTAFLRHLLRHLLRHFLRHGRIKGA